MKLRKSKAKKAEENTKYICCTKCPPPLISSSSSFLQMSTRIYVWKKPTIKLRFLQMSTWIYIKETSNQQVINISIECTLKWSGCMAKQFSLFCICWTFQHMFSCNFTSSLSNNLTLWWDVSCSAWKVVFLASYSLQCLEIGLSNQLLLTNKIKYRGSGEAGNEKQAVERNRKEMSNSLAMVKNITLILTFQEWKIEARWATDTQQYSWEDI